MEFAHFQAMEPFTEYDSDMTEKIHRPWRHESERGGENG